MRRKATAFYSGVFLLCMSVLMLQIAQTRVLSVVSYYYMAFLTISMAMFGLTAGALIVYFAGERFTEKTLSHDLRWTSAAYALTVFVCFLFQLTEVAPTVQWAIAIVVWLKLILLLAAPFVFAGMAVSLALTRSPFRVAAVYGVDMTGAAAGCLAVLWLLNHMDAPSAIFAIAGLAALSATCFGSSRIGDAPRSSLGNLLILRRPGFLAVGLATFAVVNASTPNGFQPVSGKSGIEQRDTFAYEKWNSFSRVVAYKAQKGRPVLWGRSPALRAGRSESRRMNIDGFAGTYMPRFNGDLRTVEFLRYDITNLAYHVRNSGRAAIIGVGSGRDMLSARLFGFRDVTGVELNGIFIDLLTDPALLRGYAGIADLPGTRFFVDDGRSWFARTRERFDLIQMSMIDTFAATGAGAFSLSENGLYTTEGWKIFLEALAPGGVLTVSRWHAPAAPVETARVLSLAMSALMAMDVENPRHHVFLASSERLSTIIVGIDPLGPADVALLERAVEALEFTTLVSPNRRASEAIFEDLLSARDPRDLDERARRYLLDVSAPTDSRPFFFNQLRLSSPGDILELIRLGKESGIDNRRANLVVTGNLLATGTLALLILLSAVLVLLVVVLPARKVVGAVDRRFVWPATVYFVLIGIGFMFVEIGLIQRMSVFMGHPTYGLSIVLFSIILSTGLGSFLSARVSPLERSQFLPWALALGIYLLSLPLWLPGLTHSFQSAGVVQRAALTVLVILPAGLLMGFAFPMGLRLIEAARATSTSPWFWAINGAAGVLAAGTAVACSIAFSIDVTVWAGAVCYFSLIPAWFLMTDRIEQSWRASGERRPRHQPPAR